MSVLPNQVWYLKLRNIFVDPLLKTFLAITDVDIELVSNLPPSKTPDDESKLPDEDVKESTVEVQEVGQTHEEPQEEDEIVPIDVNKGNLER